MNDLPKRKHPRLKGYDYNSNGAYFITLCVKDREEKLGAFVGRDDPGTPPNNTPLIELTEYGIIADKYIQSIAENYKGVFVDKYVVMTNHVHMIIMVNRNGGASGSPRPTNALIPNLIGAFKRMTNKEYGFNMWHTSYHNHIIRNETEYLEIWEYIDTNPVKWKEDTYYIS